MDCLQALWATLQPRFPAITKVLINLDNGPENHSQRAHFMQRLINLVDASKIILVFAF